MAVRLHQSLVRGEIDNRVRGVVTGLLWFLGREEPVRLVLSGNCCRDLAGCLLRFTNPRPLAGVEPSLSLVQNGYVGDMTASRKVKVPTVPLEEAIETVKAGGQIDFRWANSLYLEWFSAADGRVEIESVSYGMYVSAPDWSMSAEEGERQMEENNRHLREFVDWMAHQPQPQPPVPSAGAEGASGRASPEAEREAQRFLELMVKYEDHPHRDQMIASELAGVSVRAAAGDALSASSRPSLEDALQTDPLRIRALELAVRLHKEACERGWLDTRDGEDLSPVRQLVLHLHTAAARITSALGSELLSSRCEPAALAQLYQRAFEPLTDAAYAVETALCRNAADDAWLEGARQFVRELRDALAMKVSRLRGAKPA